MLSLLAVARLRSRARHAGLTDITQQGNHIRFAPVQLPESREVRVQRLYPKTVLKPGVRTMLVPVPREQPGAGPGRAAAGGRSGQVTQFGARPIRDQELLAWCEELVEAVFGGLDPAAPAA